MDEHTMLALEEATLAQQNEILRQEVRVAREAAEITARLVVKQFEETEKTLERLHVANTQRQAVFDAASHISIIATNADGGILFFNAGAERLLGYTEAEVTGQAAGGMRLTPLAFHLMAELTTRAQAISVRLGRPIEGMDVLFEGARRGQADQHEWTYIRKDGRAVPVELSITAMRGLDGQITGFVCAAMDLSQRKRVEEALRQQNVYLNALHDTALGLIGRLELTDLLQAIITRAAALVGTAHGYIYLLEPGQTEMVLTVGIGDQTQYVGSRVQLGQGVGGRVWQSGQALAIDDYSVWEGRLPGFSGSYLRAVAGVPLRSGASGQAQVVGVIGLVRMGEDTPFSQTQLDTLSRFADLASVALDNAHLYNNMQQELAERVRVEDALRDSQQQLQASYQREQKRRQLSDTLREVAKIVSATLSQDEVLDLILTQLENVVVYHYATVSLYAEEHLTIVARRDKTGSTLKSTRIPLDQFPLNVAALQTGQPLLVPDVGQEPRWRYTQGTANTHSFLNAPLLVKDKPIGLLSIGRNDETPYTEEDAQTVFAFASQVAVALENTRLHAYEVAQVERELAIARQIQVSLLPAESPHIYGLDIAAYSQPAHQVGGDFYTYFVFDQDQLGLAVGDVSGKGIQAALMMALSSGLLINQVRRKMPPSELLVEMNEEIYPHTRRNNLNTAMCYLILQRANGQVWDVCVANAGMIAPLVRRPDGQVDWLDVQGLPLGIEENVTYAESQHSLIGGSALILSSDGLVEAMDAAGALYSFDRLAQCLAAAPKHASAQALKEWILEDVRTFTGGLEAHDDLTLLVINVGSNS